MERPQPGMGQKGMDWSPGPGIMSGIVELPGREPKLNGEAWGVSLSAGDDCEFIFDDSLRGAS